MSAEIEKEWIAYRDAVYPAKNGQLDQAQEKELRQTLFAAALVVLTHAMKGAVTMSGNKGRMYINQLVIEAEAECRRNIKLMEQRN